MHAHVRSLAALPALLMLTLPCPSPYPARRSGGRVCAYDLTHGMLSDVLVLPPANEVGQERRLVRAVRSPKQAAWLAFTKVGGRESLAAGLLRLACQAVQQPCHGRLQTSQMFQA